MSDFKTIQFSISKRIATITFNRPDDANGLNYEMAHELNEAAIKCDNSNDVKAVIITAQGRFFCAGGDVKAMQNYAGNNGEGVKRIADELHRALSVFARMDAPVITAINGTAAGAGFSMAITGDLVLAVESAKFTMAYSKIGLSPDGSSSYYLPRLIGLRKAQELMFTNRVLSAQEALDWGLVTQLVADADLMLEAQKLAEIFVSGARGSNSMIKKLLLTSFDNSFETQMELEGRGIADCANSPDGQEGVAAFVEKRKPTYT